MAAPRICIVLRPGANGRGLEYPFYFVSFAEYSGLFGGPRSAFCGSRSAPSRLRVAPTRSASTLKLYLCGREECGCNRRTLYNDVDRYFEMVVRESLFPGSTTAPTVGGRCISIAASRCARGCKMHAHRNGQPGKRLFEAMLERSGIEHRQCNLQRPRLGRGSPPHGTRRRASWAVKGADREGSKALSANRKTLSADRQRDRCIPLRTRSKTGILSPHGWPRV